MAVGARIRNEGGSLVQIDPSYENLALKAVGSVVTTPFASSGAGAAAGTATIQVGGCNEPLLAVYCDAAFVGLRRREQSGTTYTWEIVASAPGVTVQYWVFDTTDVAQMQFVMSKGLRIRNPSNNRVVFDSRYKYMRLSGMVSVTAGTSEASVPVAQSSGFAIGLADTGNALVIVGGSGPVTPPAWFHQNVAYTVGFKAQAGSVAYRLITLASSTSEGGSNEPPRGTAGSLSGIALIMDVRNY